MTVPEIRKYIEDSCYDCHGHLDQDRVRTTLSRYGQQLTHTELFGLMGWMVYRPDKDVRRK